VKQLAGSDAIFLSLETPTTHAHIGGVFVIEPVSADFGFERHCAERLPLAPRFTSKLREVPLGLDRPYFVDDPDFDVANHLHRVAGRLDATYPISIIMPGMGLNITVLSYVDRVDFGFTVDPDLVPDPWYLSDGIPIAMDELKEAAGIDRATPLRPNPPEENPSQ
jgi:hypothetical protein